MNTSILIVEEYRKKILSFSHDREILVESSNKILTIETPNVEVNVEWLELKEMYFTRINPKADNKIEINVNRCDYSDLHSFQSTIIDELYNYISERG